MNPQAITDRLRQIFGDRIVAWGEYRGQGHVVVRGTDHLALLRYLRETDDLRFDMLTDVTAVDHRDLEGPERYAVVYHLYSTVHNHRYRVKAAVPENDPEIDSTIGLWDAALWGEREVHDMFGIRFRGHPDLRRLLMPEGYPGFPLRKDYPLQGRGERDLFPRYDREQGWIEPV